LYIAFKIDVVYRTWPCPS